MRSSAEILAAMSALTDAAEAESRVLTDAEVETYEAAEAELRGVNKTAELSSRQAAYKTPIVGLPGTIAPSPKGDEALEFAFGQYLRTGRAGAELFAQTVGSDAAGGYLTPPGFRAKLVERLVAFGGIRGLAEILDTGNGNPIEWPTVDDTSATAADIVAEGAASAAGADIAFGTKTLGAYRYAATGTGNVPIKVSVELLQDAAFDVAAFVARALANRIGRKQAKDLATGTGTAMPLGLFAGAAGDVVTASGSVPTYAKLNALVHALDPEYRPTATWVFNDATAAVIEGILDTTGRPILVPSINGIEGSVSRPTLLGYPVVIDQGAPDLSNAVRGIAFGDIRQAYIVRNVKDVQVLVNPYAATGYVVYDAWARMDATVQNANAVKTMSGLT